MSRAADFTEFVEQRVWLVTLAEQGLHFLLQIKC